MRVVPQGHRRGNIIVMAKKKEHYKQYGFDCLIIWEDELKDIDKVVTKIKRFTRS
jgi:G:T-mismatch repair DNA endonuclease (very short patch repair protein)